MQIQVQQAPTTPQYGGYVTPDFGSSQQTFSPLPPQQQSMNNDLARPIFAPVEGIVPGVSRLLYHGYASERADCMHTVRGCTQPWTCACLPGVKEHLKKGRYVQVYDNKLEINEPDSCCIGLGTCVVRDRISTVHFDRAVVQNAAKADGCGPECAHADCCPSCFNTYGETLVIYSDRPNCCSLCSNCCLAVNTSASLQTSNSGCIANAGDWSDCLPCCCFPTHKLVFGLDNVSELAQKINAARGLKAAPRAQPPF